MAHGRIRLVAAACRFGAGVTDHVLLCFMSAFAQGRLYNTAGGGGWAPDEAREGTWLQVDMGKDYYVKGIVTQGAPADHRVRGSLLLCPVMGHMDPRMPTSLNGASFVIFAHLSRGGGKWGSAIFRNFPQFSATAVAFCLFPSRARRCPVCPVRRSAAP